MSGFAVSKKIDIFPRKARIELHVVYVGTYPTVPACFGQVNEIMIALVDLFELELEVGKFVIGEIAFAMQSVSQSFFFFNHRDEDGLTCFIPAFAFAFDGDGYFATSAYNCFTKGVVVHVA